MCFGEPLKVMAPSGLGALKRGFMKRLCQRVILTSVLVLAAIPAGYAARDKKAAPPATLAPYFTAPAEFAQDLGNYRSPLRFDDGAPVRNKQDWARRREEILRYWHGRMGPWPPEIVKPKVEVLQEERRENFLQQRVRVQVAPDRHNEGYLMVPEATGKRRSRLPAVLVVYYDPEAGAGQGKELRDFGYQLAKRGFVALSIGSPYTSNYPAKDGAVLQPLSYLAYVAANCRNALANDPRVDPQRIGIVGHSYGGKWAMFASCLNEKFACAAWSDGGIVFDESRSNVNYWEPWYLGFDRAVTRKPGVITPKSPRTGPYKQMMEDGRDLHELHALMAPRPFLVSGGSEDPPMRWKALNHTVAVNRLLGYENRVAMTNRPAHSPTPESNEQIYQFFHWALKHPR